MPQFPDFDARRIRRYSAIGTGLLIFVVLKALHRLTDWFGFSVEHKWEEIVLTVVVAVTVYMPAQIAAKWLVQRYPTTSATYD